MIGHDRKNETGKNNNNIKEKQTPTIYLIPLEDLNIIFSNFFIPFFL
jgi:hypothetical protein